MDLCALPVHEVNHGIMSALHQELAQMQAHEPPAEGGLGPWDWKGYVPRIPSSRDLSSCSRVPGLRSATAGY